MTHSGSEIEFYVNGTERLAELNFYRQGVQYSNTSSLTVASSLIPDAYRPSFTVKAACNNPTTALSITSGGNLVSNSSSTGTKTLNAFAMWHY